MAFGFFSLLTSTLRQAYTKNTNLHEYCCSNFVTLLNVAKVKNFDL